MFEYSVGQFEVEGKSEDWHTAFYYLAEHIRLLSGGRLNHKELYSLVGVDGRYVNHANPLVRKRTAGALSRIVHTKRYAQDMRSRYMQNVLAFDQAAHAVCSLIVSLSGCGECELVRYLEGPCWDSVCQGLERERSSWRGDLDLYRARLEMKSLFSEGADDQSNREDSLPLSEVIVSAMFHVLAFGHLDFTFARSLVDLRPTGPLSSAKIALGESGGACMIKFADEARSAVVGIWPVPSNRPFTIGRYTDCDVIETDERLSRVHCCVYSLGGAWCFEDLGSRNGSIVEREGQGIVFDSLRDGPRVPFALMRGDSIVLAGSSYFWFGALQHDVRYSVVAF